MSKFYCDSTNCTNYYAEMPDICGCKAVDAGDVQDSMIDEDNESLPMCPCFDRKRGVGRPPVQDKLISKTFRLPQSDIDKLERLAGEQQITVSKLIRQLINR